MDDAVFGGKYAGRERLLDIGFHARAVVGMNDAQMRLHRRARGLVRREAVEASGVSVAHDAVGGDVPSPRADLGHRERSVEAHLGFL